MLLADFPLPVRAGFAVGILASLIAFRRGTTLLAYGASAIVVLLAVIGR
jgi:hypothetical protein